MIHLLRHFVSESSTIVRSTDDGLRFAAYRFSGSFSIAGTVTVRPGPPVV
jgi:hypothetical protein